MLFSFIIPAYNAEKYISNCIESIIKQDCSDCEIIVVDDGSNDNTSNIIKQIIEKNNLLFLKIISKNNGGVSSARNVGIKEAIGDYIVFLDSDDTFTDNAIENLKKIVKFNKMDLCIFSHIVSKNNIKENYPLCSLENFSIQNENSMNLFSELISKTNNIFLGYPWGKIYRRNILIENNLLFDEKLVSSEDFLFFFSYVLLCRSIIFNSYTLVEYNIQNGNSLSTNRSLNRVLSNLYVYNYVFNKVNEIDSECFNVLNYISSSYISNVLDSRFDSKNDYKIIKKKLLEHSSVYKYNKTKKIKFKRFLIKVLGLKKSIYLLKLYGIKIKSK